MTDERNERWQAEVNARLARLELRADEAELLDAGFGLSPSAPKNSDDEYLDLDSWVKGYFCTTFLRPLGGEFRWCTQWREHREAVERLDALWCSWVALRSDSALGMSRWFQQFLDPQLLALMSARGTFAGCSVARHEPVPARHPSAT